MTAVVHDEGYRQASVYFRKGFCLQYFSRNNFGTYIWPLNPPNSLIRVPLLTYQRLNVRNIARVEIHFANLPIIQTRSILAFFDRFWVKLCS